MNTCNDVNAVQVLNEYGKTDGHDLIRQGTFPRGSIQKEGAPGEAPWRCTGGELAGFDYMEGTEGGRYPFVRLRKNQRLWQDIQLPAKAESRTDYQLGVEYNAGHFKECTVYVYRLEDGQVQGQAFFTHLLKGAGEQWVENADPAWMTLALTAINVPTDTTDIRVVFETPNPDITAYLYLKQTRSLLSLPALGENTELQLIVDPEGERLIHPEGALALCHGAAHRLEVKAPDGDAWLNLPISLLWLQDDNLPGEYGLTSTPPFNRNNGSQEEFYQDLLPSETAVWLLDAQGGTDTPSGEVTLGLGSFHQADKFALPAHLGDFRFEVKKPQWDGETPIVELGNSTDLTAAVVSAFDDTRVIKGKKVEWWLNGSHYKDEVTDATGTTKLAYTPRKGDGGTTNSATFTVKCVDAYEKTNEQSLAVKVYDTTPWLEDLEVLLDGEPISDLKTLMHLTQKEQLTLTLKPKPGSFFFDKEITLDGSETGQLLGITFTPIGPRKMGPEGLSWTIIGGDESGFFTLEAKASGLAVGLELKGGQVSANLADEATLVFHGGPATTNIPLFRRDWKQLVSIVPHEGSPLSKLGLATTLKFVQHGSLTAEHLQATPAYGGPSTKWTDAGHEWSIQAAAPTSGLFGLEVEVEGFSTPLKADKIAVLSRYLTDEVDVLIDDKRPGEGSVVFRREQNYTVSITPKPGSPIGETRLDCWAIFHNESLPADQCPADPPYGERKSMTPDGFSWELSPKAQSGAFELTLWVTSFGGMADLRDCVVLSKDLADEATLVFRGGPATTNIPLFRRDWKQFISIVPHEGSPLSKLGLATTLKFVPLGSLSAEHLQATPAYDGPSTEWTDAGHEWSIQAAAPTSGLFGLEVEVEGFNTSLKADKIAVLSRYLADEVDVLINGKPPEEHAQVFWPKQKQISVRITPKPGSPIGETRLNCRATFHENTLPADQCPAVPPYGTQEPMTPDGFSWELSPTQAQRGVFDLTLWVGSFGGMAHVSNCVVLSRDLKGDVDFDIKEDENGATWFVTVAINPDSPIAPFKLKGVLGLFNWRGPFPVSSIPLFIPVDLGFKAIIIKAVDEPGGLTLTIPNCNALYRP